MSIFILIFTKKPRDNSAGFSYFIRFCSNFSFFFFFFFFVFTFYSKLIF